MRKAKFYLTADRSDFPDRHDGHVYLINGRMRGYIPMIVFKTKLSHKSGFKKVYMSETNYFNSRKIAPENFEIMKLAKQASSIKEREEIMSQVKPNLNKFFRGLYEKGSSPGIELVSNVPHCLDVLGKIKH